MNDRELSEREIWFHLKPLYEDFFGGRNLNNTIWVAEGFGHNNIEDNRVKTKLLEQYVFQNGYEYVLTNEGFNFCRQYQEMNPHA